eukprot:g5245.t1
MAMVFRCLAAIAAVLLSVAGGTVAGEIVFVSNRDGNYEIYIANEDGSKPRNLTKHKAFDYSSTWSPDGRHLAFQTRRDGNDEIYVMKADGSGLVNLTKNPARDSGPNWSPDGKRLLFVSNRDHKSGEIYVMDRDGTNVKRLTNNTAYEEMPVWSPDGKRIAFCRLVPKMGSKGHAGNGEIFVMNADGSKERRLTNRAGFDSGPAWSPDGRKIAFHSTHDKGADILVMNADGKNPTAITGNRANEYYPAWSPDGKSILYCAGQKNQYNLWRMRPDGTAAVRLTNHPRRNQAPAWRPKRQPSRATIPADECASARLRRRCWKSNVEKGFIMSRAAAEFYCLIEGKESGPFTVTQVKKLARSGNLKKTDQVRKSNSESWTEASQFSGLFEDPSSKRRKSNKPSSRRRRSTDADDDRPDLRSQDESAAAGSLLTKPIVSVAGVGLSAPVLGVLVIVLGLGVASVFWFMKDAGAGGDPAESFAAFRWNLGAEGKTALWKISTGSIKPGRVEWSGTFQHVDPDGRVTIKLPKLPTPVNVQLRTTMDGVALWKSVPAGKEVRFEGTLRNGAVVRTYYGMSATPEVSHIVRDCFETDSGEFTAAPKQMSVEHRMATRVDVVFAVSGVRPLDVPEVDSKTFTKHFAAALQADGAKVKTDEQTGNVTSIIYADATSRPRRVSAKKDKSDSEFWRRYALFGRRKPQGWLENESLRSFAKFPELKTLDLTSSNIDDEGLKHLTECTALEQLGLVASITDKGVGQLKELKRLRILSLDRCNDLTDAAIDGLIEISTLRIIVLPKTISKDAALKLRNANHNCAIFSSAFKGLSTSIKMQNLMRSDKKSVPKKKP